MTEHWRGISEEEEKRAEERMERAKRIHDKPSAILGALWAMYTDMRKFQDELTMTLRTTNFLLLVIAAGTLFTFWWK